MWSLDHAVSSHCLSTRSSRGLLQRSRLRTNTNGYSITLYLSKLFISSAFDSLLWTGSSSIGITSPPQPSLTDEEQIYASSFCSRFPCLPYFEKFSEVCIVLGVWEEAGFIALLEGVPLSAATSSGLTLQLAIGRFEVRRWILMLWASLTSTFLIGSLLVTLVNAGTS